MHHGFVQIPLLIIRGKGRFGNNRLTPTELGLYVGLKDLCGDDRVCYRTLRKLGELLNTSPSTLSRYIPKLVKKGVIEAELKQVKDEGHEVWFIRIINVWNENDEVYTPKREYTDLQELGY